MLCDVTTTGISMYPCSLRKFIVEPSTVQCISHCLLWESWLVLFHLYLWCHREKFDVDNICLAGVQEDAQCHPPPLADFQPSKCANSMKRQWYRLLLIILLLSRFSQLKKQSGFPRGVDDETQVWQKSASCTGKIGSLGQLGPICNKNILVYNLALSANKYYSYYWGNSGSSHTTTLHTVGG